ncbi:MAG: HAMP domain-containing sensor histidine kinase [Pseudomonadota bacterium]
MKEKWRPPLALVLGGALTSTLVIALLGLIIMRFLGPEIGFQNAALSISIAIAILTLVLGMLLVRLLLRPIDGLSQYAARAREIDQNHPEPPEHVGTRELYSMARSIVAMTETLRTRETTIRAYTDHVTHELKTPVSSIIAAAELLGDSTSIAASDRELIAQITSGANQMRERLDALRSVALVREASYHGSSTLAQCLAPLNSAFPELQLTASGSDIEIPMLGDGVFLILEQMVANSRAHGATQITLSVSDQISGSELRVRDNGTGVSPGNRDRIFEAFFTTRRELGGTGMGLAIVMSILSAHHAKITLLEEVEGAEFQIKFPRN